MKNMQIFIIVCLIGVLPACSSNIRPTLSVTSIIDTSTIVSTQNVITPTETIYATQEIKGRVSEFSVLNDEIKQRYPADASIFISKDSKTHFPVEEDEYWVMRDKFRHITRIKHTGADNKTISFTIERIGGKTNTATVSTGAFIWLFFVDVKNQSGGSLYYDPAGNQFIDCPYNATTCFLPPSAVFLKIRENGRVQKGFDESNTLWCTNLNNYYELRFGNLPKSDPLATSTAYQFPGNDKVINWVTECPMVKIEEISHKIFKISE